MANRQDGRIARLLMPAAAIAAGLALGCGAGAAVLPSGLTG